MTAGWRFNKGPGAASIRAEFEDGLVIELKGWARPRDK